jgi:outer membrane protein assembly factor BamB
MGRGRRAVALVALAAAALAAALAAGFTTAATQAQSTPSELLNWPEFGLNPQRTNSTDAPTGITADNVASLHRRVVDLPGTADSSPIYLHGAIVHGKAHNTIFVTTSYGITLAIDANSGAILWRFTPHDIDAWSGTYQFTTASPIAGPNHRFIFATSPNGFVHKLSVASGHEARGWPTPITVLPTREKLTASLNIAGGLLLASTGGYDGDTPPYVGHVAAISRQSGRIEAVFNTLCADRHRIISPPTCPASDSAILSRSGPVVEPGGKRLLIATGNAPWNGTTDFGDSVIELTLPHLRFRQAYTPTDQATLNNDDLDLGSGSPALLPGDLALIGGKDGMLRLLNLSHLDGHAPGLPEPTGGELQLLPTPGSGQPFTTPAVWHDDVFVADYSGTTAFTLSGARLHSLWSNSTPGTSPIVAGGLLYIFDPTDGGVNVYDPATGNVITTLPSGSGHWNSPIVVDGHVIEPEGDDNNDPTSGVLDIWSLPAS